MVLGIKHSSAILIWPYTIRVYFFEIVIFCTKRRSITWFFENLSTHWFSFFYLDILSKDNLHSKFFVLKLKMIVLDGIYKGHFISSLCFSYNKKTAPQVILSQHLYILVQCNLLTVRQQTKFVQTIDNPI